MSTGSETRDWVNIELPAPNHPLGDGKTEIHDESHARLMEQVKAMAHIPAPAPPEAEITPPTPQPVSRPSYRTPHLPSKENDSGLGWIVGLLFLALLAICVATLWFTWPKIEPHLVEWGVVKRKEPGTVIFADVPRASHPKPVAGLAARRLFYVTFLIPGPNGTSVLSGIDIDIDSRTTNAVEILSLIRRVLGENHKGSVIVAISELNGGAN